MIDLGRRCCCWRAEAVFARAYLSQVRVGVLQKDEVALFLKCWASGTMMTTGPGDITQ